MSVSFATVSSSGASVRTCQHLVDTVLDLSRVAANDSGELARSTSTQRTIKSPDVETRRQRVWKPRKGVPEGGIRPAGGQNLGPGNGVLETQERGMEEEPPKRGTAIDTVAHDRASEFRQWTRI